MDYITRPLNVENGEVGKAFNRFSGQANEQNSKPHVQHKVMKLVRELAAVFAVRRSKGLCLSRGRASQSAAEAEHVQMLTEQEERYHKIMHEQDAWVLGCNGTWAEAQMVQAEQETAFINTFVA